MSLAQHLSKTEMFKSALRLQERDLHNVPPQSALFEKPLKEKANLDFAKIILCVHHFNQNSNFDSVVSVFTKFSTVLS